METFICQPPTTWKPQGHCSKALSVRVNRTVCMWSVTVEDHQSDNFYDLNEGRKPSLVEVEWT